MPKKSTIYPGRIVNRLTVVEKCGKTPNGVILWKVVCTCGKEFSIQSGNLIHQQACRDCADQITAEKLKVNIGGMKFGRLTAIEEDREKRHLSKDSKRTFVYWKCVCDCGNISSPRRSSLVSGDTKSCGCGMEESKRQNGINSRKGPGEAALNARYIGYLRGATTRGHSFELTKDQFITLTQQSCTYCGKLPDSGHKSIYFGDYVYNGIDRVDNDKGYTIDNCVTCCVDCNYKKRKQTTNEFYSWVTQTYNHLKNTGRIE